MQHNFKILKEHRERFNYKEAFSRNHGWITHKEQEILRNSKVAIAGLGGVGGDHAITCARLGISNFHIVDFDDYDVGNFNRQAGAMMSTLGLGKLNVTENTLSNINPEAAIKLFKNGVTDENLNEFLDGVDIYIDSLDIYALDIRRKIFQKCHEKGIPAITAAPIGMGTALLCFTKNSMPFEEYFNFAKVPNNANEQEREKIKNENIVRFIIGVAPNTMHTQYIADRSGFDFKTGKTPSTRMGISLATGVLCTNVLKLLLNRGHVITAPKGLHIDAYLNRCKKTWRPYGNKNPLQKIAFKYICFLTLKNKAKG